jgi:hypothetical protein
MGRSSVNGVKIKGVWNSVLGLSTKFDPSFATAVIPGNIKTIKPPRRRNIYK